MSKLHAISLSNNIKITLINFLIPIGIVVFIIHEKYLFVNVRAKQKFGGDQM
jgi:hypothetical protein